MTGRSQVKLALSEAHNKSQQCSCSSCPTNKTEVVQKNISLMCVIVSSIAKENMTVKIFGVI